MFRFIYKSFSCSNKTLQLFKFYTTSSRKPQKSMSIQHGTQYSFTAQYLMNQCGFSMERALLYSSRYISFDNNIQPDSVLAFFKNQGFTESHIRKLVANEPRILSSDPEHTLLPKIQFFRSKGFSDKDLGRILSFVPELLLSSLEKRIKPAFSFVEGFLGCEKDANLAILRCARILIEVERYVKPNIEILVGAGMSRSAVAYFLKVRPFLFVIDADKLKETVKQVRAMGMVPGNYAFGAALVILMITRRSTWNKRMEGFKRWGCSEEDVLRSFTTFPWIMIVSEAKLNGIMSFFVHEIGWEPAEVVKKYFMFTPSLKKRMIPRWSVYKELLSKGLIKKEVSLSTLFTMKEGLFLQKFVNCYEDEAPLLSKLYIEKQASK